MQSREGVITATYFLIRRDLVGREGQAQEEARKTGDKGPGRGRKQGERPRETTAGSRRGRHEALDSRPGGRAAPGKGERPERTGGEERGRPQRAQRESRTLRAGGERAPRRTGAHVRPRGGVGVRQTLSGLQECPEHGEQDPKKEQGDAPRL